jgi:hypothetical protein
MIRLEDYVNLGANGAQGGAPGVGSAEELDMLVKSLDAGSKTGRELTNLTGQSGAPLKLESLEKTLKVLTYKESDVVFWKNIPKKEAYNTVEEYNQLTGYGQDGAGAFTSETELPDEDVTQYTRRSQLVKFMATTRAVSLAMSMVKSQVKPVETEIKNGTLYLMRAANRGLYFGDSDLIPEEFNGMFAQQRQADVFSSFDAYMNDSTVVVDLRGKALKEGNIETASNNIVENFGLGDVLYAPPTVLSSFVQRFYGNKFIQPNTEQISAGRMGQRVKSFEGQFGDVQLQKDIFLNKRSAKLLTAAATSSIAPAAPTATSITAVAATDALSKWSSTDAGSYLYAVSSFNKYGESALTSMSGSTTAIVANGAVDLVFTAGSGTYAASGYRIYRGVKGVSATTGLYYPVFSISTAQLTAGYDGAAAGGVRDRDRFLPDCNQAMLIQHDTEVLEFAQLAPLMKLDLAIVSPAYRFLCLMYGTPFLYAPKKMVRFINVGTDLTV